MTNPSTGSGERVREARADLAGYGPDPAFADERFVAEHQRALDAFAAAVRSQTIAECREAVYETQHYGLGGYCDGDSCDCEVIPRTDGEYVHEQTLLAALDEMEESK